MRGGTFAGLAALLASAPVAAADLPATAVPAPPIAEVPAFSVSLTAYLWATSLNGRSATLPPLPATKIDLKFSDALQDADGGIMGTAEFRYGRWGLVTDLMYSQASPGGALPGPYFSSVKLRTRSLTLQTDLLYRAFESPTVDFDLGIGARYWHLDNKLKVEPGILNLLIVDEQSEDWIDPVIAARAVFRLSGPWSLTLAGDVGGFDVGSKVTYQALGTVNYQWNENLSLRAGYRLLSVDYKKNGYLYYVRMHGPLLALTYRF